MKTEVQEKINIKSLDECLAKLPEEKLNKLYNEALQMVEEKRPKKISKEEIIDYVYGALAAKYVTSLLFINDKDLKDLQEVIEGKNKGKISKKLIEENFIFQIDNEYYAPEELREALKKFKSKKTDKERKDLIISYYIITNGALKIDKLIELMKESGYSTTRKEVLKVAEDFDFSIENDIIHVNYIAQHLNEENNLLKIKEKNEYKIISFKEMVSMTALIEEMKNSGKIQNHLKKKVKNKEKLNEVAEEIFSIIFATPNFVENVDQILENYNIKLTDDEIDNLYEELGYMAHILPSWSLNGFTPHELYCDKDDDDDENSFTFEDFSDDEKKEIYIIHYTDINGIITIDKMVEILNNSHHLKTSKKEVTKIAKECTETYVIDNYICFENFSKEDLETIKELKKFDDYKIIDDIDKLIDERDDNEFNLNIICTRYDIDENIIDEIDFCIMYGIFNEDILEEVLKHNKKAIPLKKQRQLYKEIKEIIKDTRMWLLNGYKPSELNNSTVKKEKIGRNEPCPCGSGKKYKQCCGK